MARGLTAKQARFVQEYAIDGHGTNAAIRAGVPKGSAHALASKWLKMDKVASALGAIRAPGLKKAEISQARVLRELAAIAFSNHTHFMQDEKTGRLILSPGAPKRAHAAVSSVKYKTTTAEIGENSYTTREVEFRLWNKPDMLKLAGRHVDAHGFSDRVEEKDAERVTEIHIHGNIEPPGAPRPVGATTTSTGNVK